MTDGTARGYDTGMFSIARDVLEDLRRRYAEPYRAYHDLSHIAHLLEHFAERRAALRAPAAVELAIWYHDAVYHPGKADNEERSADLLSEQLGGILGDDLLRRARAMILATKSHRLPETGDADLAADCEEFLDMDLSILGAEPERFAHYEEGIAREYEPIYGAEAFRKGRAAVLAGFLARVEKGELYFTDYFSRGLSAATKRNLAASLAALGQTAPVNSGKA